MKTGTKRASVGVLGLPLIAALAALFIAAFVAFSFARAGPVSAANEVGIVASDTTSVDLATVVQDDGITALQPDLANVTEEFTGVTPGLGPWILSVTYGDAIVSVTVDTAVVATEPGDGILNYSAIPIDTNGIIGYHWMFFSIGAILAFATTVGLRITARHCRSEITKNDIDGLNG